jgi:hypothetical protein
MTWSPLLILNLGDDGVFVGSGSVHTTAQNPVSPLFQFSFTTHTSSSTLFLPFPSPLILSDNGVVWTNKENISPKRVILSKKAKDARLHGGLDSDSLLDLQRTNDCPILWEHILNTLSWTWIFIINHLLPKSLPSHNYDLS